MDTNLISFFDAVQHHIGALRMADVLSLRDTRSPKPDGSYLTQGDLLVQEVLASLMHRHLPNARLISEELEFHEDGRNVSGMVVVLDPIDGTENFTSGLAEWGVSIACYQDGRHAGSLLGAPEMGRWMRTGDRFPRFNSRIRGLSSSLDREQILAVGVGPEYRMLGCCVVNMMNVIQGCYLSFENPKGASSWDILAGLNLALEHGLHVTVDDKPYDGRYLYPDRRYRFRVEQAH